MLFSEIAAGRWEEFHTPLIKSAANDAAHLQLAFSHDAKSGFRYVQDRIWEQRDSVWERIEKNAVIYVCVDGLHMAPDVRTNFLRMHAEKTKSSPEASENWMRRLEEAQRYLVDVFGQKKLWAKDSRRKPGSPMRVRRGPCNCFPLPLRWGGPVFFREKG